MLYRVHRHCTVGAVYDRAFSARVRRNRRGHRPRLQWDIVLILLLITIFLWACSAKKEQPEESEHVVTVDVAPVLNSAISLKVTAEALLYPLQQAAIVPKISAPVKKFYVDRGAHVRAGQVLAELENSDIAGSVAENQAG